MALQALGFLKQFLGNPKHTGAIAPSSRGLARQMALAGGVSERECVVEFGPGTGVFTREILRTRSSSAVSFALEINPRFVAATRKACPEAIVYETSAEHIDTYLAKHGRETCDCIISGLPWAAFDDALQRSLLNAAVAALEPGGVFCTFAYLQGLLLPAGKRFRALLEEHFTTVSTTRTVWANLPPALIYRCEI